MIMTNWFKSHTRVPERCTYGTGCHHPPVIFWQMHYNREIIGMAFCKDHAIELTAGLMRDIQSVNRGMEWVERVEALVREKQMQAGIEKANAGRGGGNDL